MKTLGIIGGLGPQTTAKIYLSVIDLIRKDRIENYPAIVMYNLPFPFIIEYEAIIQGINSDKMLPYLLDGARILEKTGATFGILPCNTLHKYINDIRKAVKIPFLSILEETLIKLKSLKTQTVGILASQTTINSKIYDEYLRENNICIIYPEKEEQADINKIIFHLLNGEESKLYGRKIEKIAHSLNKKGAQSIILACTDLQMVSFKVNSSITIVDTTELLIQASVRELIN